ncbi:MoaD/ThiS family protein [Candidatus Neomarinimicrobiota bacterium]
MSAQIEFLGPLKQLVNGQDVLEIQAASVGEALQELGRQYENLAQRLLTEDGTLHRHINIYVNEDDIRFQDHLQTSLSQGDRVTVISAIAGG